MSLRICASCPWLKENHGKPHPGGWYRPANLRRLWNGLRTGRAAGMVCHASDPASAEYGSVNAVHPATKPRQCAGALILVIRHVNECGATKNLDDYQQRHGPSALTLPGLRMWVSRYLFRDMPAVEDYRINEVGLPWEKQGESCEDGT